jgi:MFS family permease
VIYVSGVLLLIAASRVLDLRHQTEPEERLHIGMLRRRVSVLSTIEWLARQPAVATMIFVAALAGTAQVVISTLGPRYVQDVLHVDPADAVYVFAPSAIGLVLALLLLPRLISRLGERATALLGFTLMASTLFLLGFVSKMSFLDDISPLHVLDLFDLEVSGELRTAAVLAVPLGFGLALATTSVQTYVNRRVPLSHQGRTFALQSTIKNGSAILPLTTLGAAAGAFGVETVLIASPFVLLGLAFGLLQLARHFGGEAPAGGLEVMATFWEEPAPEPLAVEPATDLRPTTVKPLPGDGSAA